MSRLDEKVTISNFYLFIFPHFTHCLSDYIKMPESCAICDPNCYIRLKFDQWSMQSRRFIRAEMLFYWCNNNKEKHCKTYIQPFLPFKGLFINSSISNGTTRKYEWALIRCTFLQCTCQQHIYIYIYIYIIRFWIYCIVLYPSKILLTHQAYI